MMHFMDEINEELQRKLAVYIRAHQDQHGGWPLFHGGDPDISCTVKAYYALKLAGDDASSDHMLKAKALVLSLGGAAKVNVFTRICLAMFQQIPWRGVPFIPVEIMYLPKWFPFHLSKVSYWSRTVMVPLFVLCSLKSKARNPLKISINELFVVPPTQEKNYFPVRSTLNKFILQLERIGFRMESLIPDFIRKKALQKAENWIIERLNGTAGLGAIFPAMINAYEALDQLGYEPEHPFRVAAKEALENLMVIRNEDAYCQPCMSPVWDTLLTVCALDEAHQGETAVDSGLVWLKNQQLLDFAGDWSHNRPKLRPGGWPFQYKNDHYPDLDDTAFAGYTMARVDKQSYVSNISRAAEWTAGLQSKNGGFASFDADNTYYYLNEIPFADHGALLDPPTSDVSARCLMLLSEFKEEPSYAAMCERCLEYLSNEQEKDGSWFGRWGTNHIYGTWSVLIALECYGLNKQDARIQKATKWLKSIQRADGGWGEDNYSYHDTSTVGKAGKSTCFQTSWAILALLSAGEFASVAVEKGVRYLIKHQKDHGFWSDPEFTAPGFPKVFYLKYHGYNKYFPLWALARYRNELRGRRGYANSLPVKIGILVPLPQELKSLTPQRIQWGNFINISEHILVGRTGIGQSNTLRAVNQLLSFGVDHLIGWGTTAGLSPTAIEGDLLIPDAIMIGDKKYPTDQTFNVKILSHLPKGVRWHKGLIYASNDILGSVESKQELFARSHCLGADMESGVLAEAAAERKIPFNVIRSVSDPVNLGLPTPVMDSISESGDFILPSFIQSALLNPGDWGGIIKLARNFRKAQKSLNIVAEILKEGTWK